MRRQRWSRDAVEGTALFRRKTGRAWLSTCHLSIGKLGKSVEGAVPRITRNKTTLDSPQNRKCSNLGDLLQRRSRTEHWKRRWEGSTRQTNRR